MAKRRETEKPDRYFQLHHYMLKTDAWRALSAQARAVYVQIGSRYSGTNNGRLALSVRDAASECNLSRETASRALHELVDLGFTEETRHGGLSRKTRVASEWRLTAFRCDLTGAPKTCAFMQRGVPARESRLVRARPQPGRLSQTTAQPVLNDGRECPKRRHSLSQTTAHSIAECPKRRHTQADFEPSPVLNDGTHIIYQSPSARGDPTPDIPPSPGQGESGRPADEGEAAAPNAPNVTTAAAPPAFDLIDGSFRIGDRRIVLCKPAADAMDLTASLLAQQLAASNSQCADPEQRTVDALSRPALAH
jgi:hypothetical protein